MITINNINKVIDILKLVRNSTALMEFINSPHIKDNLEEILHQKLDIKTGDNLSKFKQEMFAKIFMQPEYFGKILSGTEDEYSEFALDFVLDKLYNVLKEYSETKFDEENINNDNN